MSLDADLLEQAETLASLDKKRPRQANLRRAVSAAYYAVFHLLVRVAVAALTTDPELRNQISRVLGHAEMKKGCLSFLNPSGLQEPVRTLAGLSVVPPDLRTVAEAFVELQEARHDADYNIGRSFRRDEVLNLVAQGREAFAAWDRVRPDRVATVFLFTLLFSNRWKQ